MYETLVLQIEPLTLQVELGFIDSILNFVNNMNALIFTESLEEQEIKRM